MILIGMIPVDPSEQADSDADGVGNNADSDDANDGQMDLSDNCPLTPNPEQRNSDTDSMGDACDLFPNQEPLYLPFYQGNQE